MDVYGNVFEFTGGDVFGNVFQFAPLGSVCASVSVVPKYTAQTKVEPRYTATSSIEGC